MKDAEYENLKSSLLPNESYGEKNESVITDSSKSNWPTEPYRGIKPFRYADMLIFSAREWEKEQLLNLILLYRGSLLYGQSGIGKSSLINAGLIPLLAENNLQAHILRIYPNHKQTFRVYKVSYSEKSETYLPTLFDSFSSAASDELSIGVSLKDFKATLALQTYSKASGPIPVLIFDQFEELVTLFEEAGNIAVTQDDVPVADRRAFQAELINFFKSCYYEKDLRVKFLFSFREDYLAKFSKLFRAIPDLRDHSLRAKAIDKDDIKEIIGCPFQSGHTTNPSYTAPFNDEIINLLTANLIDYFGEQDAVLTDVQVVCQYIYETNESERKGLLDITGQDGKKCINNIIQLYYARLLSKFDEEDKVLAISILSLLVLNENTRNIYHTDAIVNELKDDYAVSAVNRVLGKLDNETRLIRSEVRSGANGAYYEINSESLIPYINSLKLKREDEAKQILLAAELESEKKNAETLKAEKEAIKASNRTLQIVIAVFLFVLALAIVVGGIAYHQFKIALTNKSETYLIAAKKAGNPSLGYSIAHMRLDKDKQNQELTKFVTRLASKHNLISNILYYPDDLVAGFFKGKDTIGIIGRSSVNYFNKNGLLLKQKFFNKIVYADVKHGYVINNTSNLLASLNFEIKDTSQICRLNGQVITQFVSQQNPNVFAISPNGMLFLVDNAIYRTGNINPYKKIKLPEFGNGLSAATFTDDDKYIIAGFNSGHVIVYDLNGQKVKAFEDRYINTGVSSLAVTTDLKYVIAGGRDNTLRFFELGKLELNNANPSQIIRNATTKYLSYPDQTGQINEIVLAKDNKSFLTVSNRTILWNFDGKKIDDLNGTGNHVSAYISADGKQFLTCSSTGQVSIWEKHQQQNAWVATFSPFEYKMSELEDYYAENYDINKIYTNLDSADGRLSAILNYTASLSGYIDNVEDEDRQNLLKFSLHELSRLYVSEFAPKMYNHLTSLNKKMLINSYAQFKEDSSRLTQHITIDSRSLYDKSFDRMSFQTRALLIDTLDIQQASIFVYRFKVMATHYANEVPANYSRAIACLENGIKLGEGFIEKFPSNTLLRDNFAISYGNLSWYSLFAGDFNRAIAASKKGVSFGKKYDWIYTNLALGNLLKGDFEKAKTVYLNHKDVYQSNGAGQFKYTFLQDFTTLRKAGVIKNTDRKLTRQIEQIIKLLNTN